MILDRHDHLGLRRRHPDRDGRLGGAELDRVVEQVQERLPEALAVAAHEGHRLRGLDLQGHALALGEETEPVGRGGREAPEVDVVEGHRRDPGLDPREVQELVDHLDEVPGLDLDLRHALRGLRRQRVGVGRQRLREEADRRERRPQLVAQVVDELGANPLEAAQLGDVLQDQPGIAAGRPPGAGEERRALLQAHGQLADGGARLERGAGDLLDVVVGERLEDAPADHRPRAPPHQPVGGLVGGGDGEVGRHPHGADADQLDEDGGVTLGRGRALLGRGRPRPRPPRDAPSTPPRPRLRPARAVAAAAALEHGGEQEHGRRQEGEEGSVLQEGAHRRFGARACRSPRPRPGGALRPPRAARSCARPSPARSPRRRRRPASAG